MSSFCMKHKLKMYMNNNYIQKFINTGVYYPYIAFNYNIHTFDINEDVLINYYCTDYWQSEINKELTDIQFILEYNLNGRENRQIVNIGDNILNLGKLSEGDYWYTLRVYNLQGNSSHSIYGEFRVIDKVAYDADIVSKTATITSDILAEYGITTGDYTERTTENETITHTTKLGLQKLFYDYAENYRKIILPQDTIYTIDVEGRWSSGIAVQYYKNLLTIPSNFTVDFNGGEMKQLVSTPDQKVGYMFAINDCYDSHIINATFTGDYGTREFIPLEGFDYTPGEQGGCGIISGLSKYCSIENCRIQWFPGYVLSAGIQPVGLLSDNYTKDDGFPGETLKFTELKKGQYVTQLLSLDNYIEFGLFRLGQWLGVLYQPYGDDVLIKVHWYDENQKFIKTTIEHQYRDIKIINNARYVQAEYTFDKFTEIPTGAQIYRHNIPRNCEVKNVDFNDTRTCALNPNQANAFVIDGCTFTRCATNITPVAIDFEDGWHNMQDYCVQNCEILEPVGTGDIVIVGGFNIIFRNNKNWRVASRGFSRGHRFINNELVSVNLGLTTYRMSAFTICKNNIITESINNGLGTLSDIKLIIDNCTFKEMPYENYNPKIIVRNCTLDWNNKEIQASRPILGGTFYKCTFQNFNCSLGHLRNFIAYDCEINSMHLGALQEQLYLYNCNINNISFSNYTLYNDIKIYDSQVNNFSYSRLAWCDASVYKINVDIELKNSIFNNQTNTVIIDDSWQYKTFEGEDGIALHFNLISDNCQYLDNTILINDVILNNDKFNINIK